MIYQYIAWTDGSCDNCSSDRPGGSAYIIFDKDGKEFKRASKGFIGTSNNKMEILAIMSVVNSLPRNSSVLIHSDSEYSINVLSKTWKASKNLNQIQKYWNICRDNNITVEFRWVKGHNGDFWNELCDRMARKEYAKIKKEIPDFNKYNETISNQTTPKKKGRKTKKK